MVEVSFFDEQFFGDATQFDIKRQYQNTITESTVAVSDQLTRKQNAKRVITEPGTNGFFDPQFFGDNTQFDLDTASTDVFDVVSALRGKAVSISESVSISDNIARLVKFFRTMTESNAISELLARIQGHVRIIIDPQSMFDVAFFGDSTQFDTDNKKIEVSDQVTTRFGVVRVIAETTTISDQIARLLKSFRILTESTAISDLVARILGAKRVITDSSIAVSDDIARRLSARRTLTETTLINDLLNRLAKVSRSIAETTLVSDIVGRLRLSTRIITEAAISTMDSVAGLKTQNRIINETTVISDLISTLRARLRITILYLTKRDTTNKLTKRDSTSLYLTKRDDSKVAGTV